MHAEADPIRWPASRPPPSKTARDGCGHDRIAIDAQLHPTQPCELHRGLVRRWRAQPGWTYRRTPRLGRDEPLRAREHHGIGNPMAGDRQQQHPLAGYLQRDRIPAPDELIGVVRLGVVFPVRTDQLGAAHSIGVQASRRRRFPRLRRRCQNRKAPSKMQPAISNQAAMSSPASTAGRIGAGVSFGGIPGSASRRSEGSSDCCTTLARCPPDSLVAGSCSLVGIGDFQSRDI